MVDLIFQHGRDKEERTRLRKNFPSRLRGAQKKVYELYSIYGVRCAFFCTDGLETWGFQSDPNYPFADANIGIPNMEGPDHYVSVAHRNQSTMSSDPISENNDTTTTQHEPQSSTDANTLQSPMISPHTWDALADSEMPSPFELNTNESISNIPISKPVTRAMKRRRGDEKTRQKNKYGF
ncbi:hypothetical protein B0O99DRAFT_682592 [Bisporella sp. PMI_857]|nr:hypothetical protein B0O99DRAFT_682592 [Bisporella sp. PMI_857]